MLQETVFKALHEANGAKMVDFAGWNMPVQYRSIVEEHKVVRSACGLFDVSHMGRIVIAGPEHKAFVDFLGTNTRGPMTPGRVRYNLICKEDGGILDDVLVTASIGEGLVSTDELNKAPTAAMRKDATMIVCNAGNHPKIAAWIDKHKGSFDVAVCDMTNDYAMLALQGPRSQDILQPLTDADLGSVKYYTCTVATVFGVSDVIISRTGYTGEDGFELIFPNAAAETFFNGLIEKGKAQGLEPTGLGARDTLRLEAGMPLYGHEIGEDVNPLEAGLDWAVKLKKTFCGSEALKAVKAEGPRRALVGLEVDGKRIARQDALVLHDGKEIGRVASGTKSPTLDKIIATALIPAQVAANNESVDIEIREGVVASAKIVDLPFYKRQK